MAASVRFGSCEMDGTTRQLFRDGTEVHLPPKAFDLLAHLIAHRPRVLSKAELHRHVWPSSFVTDDSLARLISLLRAAIGDTGGSLVRTVHGVGYAFAGQVVESVSAAPGKTFRLVGAELEFVISAGEHVIGRDPAVELRIDSSKVSRRHARIVARGAELSIEDLDSKNGTFVNGRRISARETLADQTEVRIGPFVFRVHDDSAVLDTETGTE
jgi:DNA-binding winged helix-turn-helix (wHTH) protein